MWRLSSAQTGTMRRIGRKRLVRAGGERLLDQFHPGLETGRHVAFEVGRRPRLVGVDDQPRRRRCLPHRRDPRPVAVAAELDLEERPRRRRPRAAAAIASGVPRLSVKAVSTGRSGGSPAIAAADRPLRLGLEVEEGAVDRVPRRAGRHGVAQPLPVEAAADRLGHRLDRRHGSGDAFAVAGIGH